MNKHAVTLQQLESIAKTWPIRKFHPKELTRKAPLGFVEPLKKSSRAVAMEDPNAVRSFRQRLKDILMPPKQAPPKLGKPSEHVININRKGHFGSASGDYEVQRIVRAWVKHHENAERKFLPSNLASRPFNQIYRHASPAVVLNDHNIMTTLDRTTPKSDLVRNAFTRTKQREFFDVVKDPNFIAGESPRFSRHAIKRLTEDYIRRHR